MSSICLNIPAVGLGSRPPSIVSTDEGGFNEPSPEIKAKLKPAYTFDPSELETIECQIEPQRSATEVDSSILPPPPLPPCAADAAGQSPSPDYPAHTLHYVDFGYRLNPDGSESRQIFGESDLYRPAQEPILAAENQLLEQQEIIKSQYRQPKMAPSSATVTSNGYAAAKESTVVYATIKPEVPPPAELFLDCDYDNVLMGQRPDKVYHSPQTILDPTRANLLDDCDFGNSQLPEPPPPRPPLPEGPPLDMRDVEYADASDKEDSFLGEEMTADEAERLLSSR